MNAPLAPASWEAAPGGASAPPTPTLDARLSRRFLNIEDLRAGAARRLPKGVYEFIARGSEDEATLRDNRTSFQRYKLRNRALVDVSVRSARAELFGKPLSMPAAIAPTGVAGVAWYGGELELARAAARSGVPFTLATPSITSIETIASVEAGRKWYQLYMWRDRAASHALVRRARDAGFEALILTVDTAVPPIREYNFRNGFNSPFTLNGRIAADVVLHPRWLASVLLRYLRTSGMPRPVHYPLRGATRTSGLGFADSVRGDNLTWDDIGRLRDLWKGPILLKGVQRPDDAERGLREGIDGLIVSNHGGRNLDTAVAALDALPEIVAAVGDAIPVLLDSGVRRGGDILKALALGAKAVLLGRPTLYGVSVAGEAGAAHALGLLHREFDTAMAYTGCRSIAEISRDVLWTPPQGPPLETRPLRDRAKT